MVEITSKCNMKCPVCFANSSPQADHFETDVIKTRIGKLLEIAGPIPLQISGGEPTLHPKLGDIISYASGKGFKNIELVTNGIVISQHPSLLKTWANDGLSAVYLQFDGLEKETYLKIRGQDMTEVRLKCVEAARKAKLCCTLAVAVTRYVNDHELGNIVRFALDNIDTVRAINFQAATKFDGRFDVNRNGAGYSLPELIQMIEQQTGIASGGFQTNILGDHKCNGICLLYSIENRLEPLFTYLSQENIDKFLGNNKRQIIFDLFMGKESFVKKHIFRPQLWKIVAQALPIFGERPNIKSILAAKHLLIFAKSFMGSDTLDCRRLEKCVYGLALEDEIYSFCAYNNLYRFSGKRTKDHEKCNPVTC